MHVGARHSGQPLTPENSRQTQARGSAGHAWSARGLEPNDLVWITGADALALPTYLRDGITHLYRLDDVDRISIGQRLFGTLIDADRRAARRFDPTPLVHGERVRMDELVIALRASRSRVVLSCSRDAALAFGERLGRPVYWLSIDGAGATQGHAVWRRWLMRAPSAHLQLEQLGQGHEQTHVIARREFRLAHNTPAVSHQAMMAGALALIREIHVDRASPRPPTRRTRPAHEEAPSPSLLRVLGVTLRIACKRLAQRRSRKPLAQWVIGLRLSATPETLGITSRSPHWHEFEWFEPGEHRIVADPHLLRSAQGAWLFFEEKKHSEQNARLKTVRLDGDGRPSGDEQIVLERAFHLSFPGVFQRTSDPLAVYLLPEQSNSGRIQLYRSPLPSDTGTFQFSEHAVLLDNFPGIDPVLHYQNGHWYLFVTDGRDGHHDNNLHLFVSSRLEGPFQAHPSSPIHFGLRGSRMAGPITAVNGQLIRSAQNCLHRYGHGIVRYRIDTLDPRGYAETELCEFTPEMTGRDIRGLHTVSECPYDATQTLIAIDVIRHQRTQPEDTTARA